MDTHSAGEGRWEGCCSICCRASPRGDRWRRSPEEGADSGEEMGTQLVLKFSMPVIHFTRLHCFPGLRAKLRQIQQGSKLSSPSGGKKHSGNRSRTMFTQSPIPPFPPLCWLYFQSILIARPHSFITGLRLQDQGSYGPRSYSPPSSGGNSALVLVFMERPPGIQDCERAIQLDPSPSPRPPAIMCRDCCK